MVGEARQQMFHDHPLRIPIDLRHQILVTLHIHGNLGSETKTLVSARQKGGLHCNIKIIRMVFHSGTSTKKAAQCRP